MGAAESIWLSIVDAPWRGYAAFVLALLGVSLVWRGAWAGTPDHPGVLRGARDAAGWIRCFQIAVAGLCLVGVAAAWAWREPWLLALALGVLGEEMLETSRILTAIARAPRRPARG